MDARRTQLLNINVLAYSKAEIQSPLSKIQTSLTLCNESLKRDDIEIFGSLDGR